MNYPIRSISAAFWRMLHPARQREPGSGEGARFFGGRWNAKGSPALYLSADPATAVAEYYQGLSKPGMLAPFLIEATAIANLCNGHAGPADGQVAAAMTEDWKTAALIEAQQPAGWALARSLVADGAQGALVPSAQNRGGVNLVLWRWQTAGTPGEGANVTLIDPEATLVR